MSLLSSLTNRIFLAGALLVVTSIGVAIYRVNVSVTAQAEADLRAGLAEAASLVDEFSRAEFADFLVKGRLIADLPKLRAAAQTNDAPTTQPIAEEYQLHIDADLFVVLNSTEQVLASAGRIRPADSAVADILTACRRSTEGVSFWPYEGRILHASALPLDDGPTLLGTLLIGTSLDEAMAARIKRATNSDIALAAGHRIVASTLDAERTGVLSDALGESGVFQRLLGGEDYVGLVRPIGGKASTGEPLAIVLRSRTEHLRFLPALRWQIAITGVAAVFVATLVGYAIARTVTRPVRALTATMREMAATGDLARKPPAIGRWDDEDARLLATTFGQLTSALDRFQREAAQRERLSSLGRLSTVIAHEIRNPLMIIKSAVRGLRRHASPETADVATSIDEEVGRLNRVVSGVLDFARPIKFELAEADLAEICRDAAQAAQAAPASPPVTVDLAAPRLPIVTDADRVRSVLVNLLTNAQQSLQTPDGHHRNGGIRLRARPGAPGHWRVEVIDAGVGITAEDMPKLFEPFFTTRRTGSGLGLAISRNIIEGLGGSIAVESTVGAGTTVRIDLPDTVGARAEAAP
jgi:signal transduction histidine kinase